jgi:PKHD-type hydroxylase
MSHVTRLVNNPLEKLLFLPNMHVDRGFFSDGEVNTIANYCSTLPMSKGALFDADDVYNTRNAKTSFIRTPDQNTGWIYEKFNTLIGYYNDTIFGFDLVGFDYLQYAEYDVSGKHEFHMDIAFGTPPKIDYRLNENLRKITVVLMLNQQGVDFEGGDFQVNLSEERVANTVTMNKGNVLLLPSFILHRVTPITRGIRKTLVAWVIGPKFR